MKFSFTLSLLAAFAFLQIQAQQPLRRFLQPATVVNKIPYGNNAAAAHFVQSTDAKIYYEVYGQGQPVVLLHGGLFGSTIEMSDFIDSLSKKFQVIAISTRGHGKSELGKSPLTLTQRADDVIAVLNQVTKQKAMVIGFSDGGYTAYQLAATHPERVNKMVVIGAGILYPGLRKFGFEVQQAFQLDSAYWKQQIALMPDSTRLPELFEQIKNCYSKVTVGQQLLGSIQCEVMVMAGDSDEGNSVQNVLTAALLIPKHQIAIIPHAGHPAFNDNFAAAWACIAPFLKP
jgi:pimeloyl-ACP methyl ester carboxylesterase